MVKLQERALTAASFGPDDAQQPPSRRQTARRTAAGMWRENPGLGVVTRGRSVWAKRWRRELVDQERCGAIEDFGGIPRGQRVTQQRLGTPELVVCLA